MDYYGNAREERLETEEEKHTEFTHSNLVGDLGRILDSGTDETRVFFLVP